VSTEARLLEDTAEDLFEEAPCGYLSTRLDGTIIQVNRTFEAWTGRSRAELLGHTRFQDMLSPGGRIYYETHYAPLLRMQGSVREIAVEIARADGPWLPALINSVLRTDEAGRPLVIRTTIFDATERRRYEDELLRARQREQEITQQLQRSLLSGELPVSPGLELEISYLPAVRGTEVGGDWYDAFWLVEDQTLGLVVGDVVGRGITAAATMGQLRSAVRAFASTGLGPAAVLTALDEFSRRHRIGQMTTLVYAQLGIETGSLRFACAGHPPPVILEPDGDPAVAWAGRSLPINVYPGLGSRPEAFLSLPPGSSVVLYTDGLIEHRHRPQDDGIARLLAELAGRHGQPFKGLAESVVRALREPADADDVCLLAAQLTNPPPGGLAG
jgi:sigma-B regulation protein RsbU (phosphoserine phosphatase)